MARKKKGLPFVVEPKFEPIIELIGSDESGKFEIQRKGYLTVAEKAIVQGSNSEDGPMRKAVDKLREIAEKAGVSLNQVFHDMSSGTAAEYLQGHETDLLLVTELFQQYEDRQKLVTATALILTRLDADWKAEDTVKLHPDIIDDLHKLYNEEDSRCVDAMKATLDDRAEETEREVLEGKDQAKTE